MWFFDNPGIQAALLKISILWPDKYNAPWVPAPMEMVHKMLQLAEVGPDELVYDLGCGDGRIVIIAAQEYGARAVGVEIDLLRYLWCQLLITILGLRSRVRIIYGDFFSQDLSAADVLTCYLLQSTNDELEIKLKKELRPGARVISSNFTFSDLPMARADGDVRLYLLPCEKTYNSQTLLITYPPSSETQRLIPRHRKENNTNP